MTVPLPETLKPYYPPNRICKLLMRTWLWNLGWQKGEDALQRLVSL